jgi:NTE family protein
MEKHRNSLVLGGGGAKGFAHLGATTVLERAGLRPDLLCGTSAGALAGAFYAMYADKIEVFEKIEETREFKILEGLNMEAVEFEVDQQGFFMKTISTVKKKLLLVKMLRDNALVQKDDVEPVFRKLFSDISFEDLPIHLVVTAFDLVSSRDIYIKSGKLWKGVMASCAIPGIFPPVEYDKMLLIDGGITNRLPVKGAVLSGAESIIAINLSQYLPPVREMASVVNLHLRTDELLASRFDNENSRLADLVIKPALEDMRWNDFQRYEYAVKKGKESANERLQEIRRVMSRTYRYKKRLRRFLTCNTIASLLIPEEEYLFV